MEELWIVIILTEPVDQDLSGASTRVDQGVQGGHHVGHEGCHGFQGTPDVVTHDWVTDYLAELSFQCGHGRLHVAFVCQPGGDIIHSVMFTSLNLTPYCIP